MSLYGQFYRAALMPAWEQGVRKRSTLRHLRYLRETQWLSLDELLALQKDSLLRLLAHAYQNVPCYRESFDRNGFRPGDVRDLADVERLPLLTRQAAQLAGDRRRSTVAPFANLRKTTGGSTGEPLFSATKPSRNAGDKRPGSGATRGRGIARANVRSSTGGAYHLR